MSLSTKGHRVLLNIFNTEESDLGVAGEIDRGARLSQTIEGLYAGYEFQFDKSPQTKLGVFYDRYGRDYARNNENTIRTFDDGYRVGTYARHGEKVLSAMNMDFGVDYDYVRSIRNEPEDITTGEVIFDNNMHGRAVHEASIFSQLGYENEDFEGLLGVRYTYNSNFHSNVSGRGSLLYKVDDKNTLKFLAGQSFRSPSLFEQYINNSSGTTFGDENLDPETAFTAEVTYASNTVDELLFQALAFYSDYQDIIARERRKFDSSHPNFDPAHPDETANFYTNGDSFDSFGFELDMRVQLGSTYSFLSYSFVDGDGIDGTSNSFDFVPKHTASLGVGGEYRGFLASAALKLLSSARGPLEGEAGEISEQATVDVNFGYRHSVQNITVTHNLAVKNVADDQIEIPEYVQRRDGLNTVPSGYGRRIMYVVRADF